MNETKRVFVKAVMKLLWPLVRMLIRYGISHKEFSEITKKVYVDVAFKHFSISGKKNTMSRVAVLTGLGRKEVMKLSFTDVDDGMEHQVNRAIRVIGGWLQDPLYQDKNGNPKIVKRDGRAPSFTALVKEYAGDVSPGPVLDELTRSNTIERLDNDKLKLIKKGYIPDTLDTEMITIFGTHGYDFLDTLRHNLEHPDRSRFQRQVAHSGLSGKDFDAFQTLSHDQAMALLLNMNKWLSEKKTGKQTPFTDASRERFGLGIYVFRSNNDDGGKNR